MYMKKKNYNITINHLVCGGGQECLIANSSHF